ncbi:ShlB/FhaC/HecB family hemolysin secretion/activation protein [Achromobacter marplatensis]|uniref:ShlB/FhaC/HecB family hemolysin secretion/activation protein n=1 Tax=Achromobacter marplatensis TaxID=470868 RepID=UPI0039F72770
MLLSAPSEVAHGLVLFAETPCFLLWEVVWDDAEPPQSLARAAAVVVGQCVGGKGLRALQEYLINLLIDNGQVTARVVVPEQSLAAGTLTLRYLPGRISAVKGEGAIGWWRTALPTGPGGELNQRDLDQALENIRCLGSQADAAIDIVPGPFGYWTVFAGASKSTYRQTVAGFEEPIIYGGTTKQIQTGVSVVPYRGTAYKGNLSVMLLRKRTDSTLNDVPIDRQRRDVTGYEISCGHRHSRRPDWPVGAAALHRRGRGACRRSFRLVSVRPLKKARIA